METISFDDFLKVEIRCAKIIEVEEFPEARNPSYKVRVDLGEELGIKKSSAQLVANYSKDELLNRRVLCVVNFKPRQIANFMSEVLVLGIPDGKGNCFLLSVDGDTPLGSRMY